jgi:hypothetical protein
MMPLAQLSNETKRKEEAEHTNDVSIKISVKELIVVSLTTVSTANLCTDQILYYTCRYCGTLKMGFH